MSTKSKKSDSSNSKSLQNWHSTLLFYLSNLTPFLKTMISAFGMNFSMKSIKPTIYFAFLVYFRCF
jgi:hypothetical protein